MHFSFINSWFLPLSSSYSVAQLIVFSAPLSLSFHHSAFPPPFCLIVRMVCGHRMKVPEHLESNVRAFMSITCLGPQGGGGRSSPSRLPPPRPAFYISQLGSGAPSKRMLACASCSSSSSSCTSAWSAEQT